jgi:hypothetical protein
MSQTATMQMVTKVTAISVDKTADDLFICRRLHRE